MADYNKRLLIVFLPHIAVLIGTVFLLYLIDFEIFTIETLLPYYAVLWVFSLVYAVFYFLKIRKTSDNVQIIYLLVCCLVVGYLYRQFTVKCFHLFLYSHAFANKMSFIIKLKEQGSTLQEVGLRREAERKASIEACRLRCLENENGKTSEPSIFKNFQETQPL